MKVGARLDEAENLGRGRLRAAIRRDRDRWNTFWCSAAGDARSVVGEGGDDRPSDAAALTVMYRPRRTIADRVSRRGCTELVQQLRIPLDLPEVCGMLQPQGSVLSRQDVEVGIAIGPRSIGEPQPYEARSGGPRPRSARCAAMHRGRIDLVICLPPG